ncbi:MAG: CDP-diacylglycerol--glycerol-3-phosphate 3-phosphatidyltransferase [Nitrospirota bacterium]
MNLPNYITLVRIILVPFFIGLMIYGHYRTALSLFVVACITDALDGLIARLTNTKTDFGAFLDPIADKMLIISAFLTLVFLEILPAWLVMVVVSRDVILVLGSIVIYFTGHEFRARPSIIGKATTVLQLLVVILSLLCQIYHTPKGFMPVLFWMTAGFTLVSGIQYIARGIKIVGKN